MLPNVAAVSGWRNKICVSVSARKYLSHTGALLGLQPRMIKILGVIFVYACIQTYERADILKQCTKKRTHFTLPAHQNAIGV
jgi:hypothetical protein